MKQSHPAQWIWTAAGSQRAARCKSFIEAAAAPTACPAARPARPSAQEPQLERQVKSFRPCAVAARAAPDAAGIMLRVAATQRAAAVAYGRSTPASMQQARPPRRAGGGQERGDGPPRCVRAASGPSALKR